MATFAGAAEALSTPAISTYTEPVADSSLDAALSDALEVDNSGSDDAIDDTPEPVSDVPPSEPQSVPPASTPEQDGPDLDAEFADEQQTDAEPEQTDPAQEAKPAETTAATGADSLPEGVKVRTIGGKPVWTLDPEVGKQAFARAALVQEAEEILGEPVTKEALQLRQEILVGNEQIRADALSDSIEDQARVVLHFQELMNGARERGEIGHDAMAGFARATLNVAINSDPQTREAVVKDLLEFTIDDTYNQAIEESDPQEAAKLWGAAQRMEQRNFGKFRSKDEFEQKRTEFASKPKSRFARPAPAAAGQPQAQPQQAAPAEQFTSWKRETDSKIGSEAVETNVDSALSHISEDLRKKNPIVFQSLRDQLLAEVRKGLRANQQLQTSVQAAVNRARLAVNPEVRNQIAQEIVKRQSAEVKRILDAKKGPILSEFAHVFAGASNQTKQRVQAAKVASRTVPPSGGPSQSRTMRPPAPAGKYGSSADFNKDLEAAFV